MWFVVTASAVRVSVVGGGRSERDPTSVTGVSMAVRTCSDRKRIGDHGMRSCGGHVTRIEELKNILMMPSGRLAGAWLPLNGIPGGRRHADTTYSCLN